MAEAKTVHLYDIYIPQGVEEGQLRARSIEEPEVIEMAYSLQTKGLQDYLSVSLGNPELGHDKPYEIKNGSGRYHAFLLMFLIAEGNHESVDSSNGPIDGTFEGKEYNGSITVMEDKKIYTVPERLAIQMTANYNVKKTATKDAIDAMQEILYSNAGMTKDDLARTMGISLKHVHSLFKTIKLPEFAREALQNNKLTLNNAVLLSKLVNKVEEDLFRETFEKACDMVEKDFAQEVTAINENLAATASPKKATKKEFQPTAKYRSKTEAMDKLHTCLEEHKQLSEAEEDITVIGIALETVKWFLGLDEISILEQQTAYEAKKAKQEQNKEKNVEKRKKLQTFDKLYALIKDGTVTEEAVPKDMLQEYRAYAKAQEEIDKAGA